ncbi:hypothetical protein [Halocatena halophila]|uniref:hypothetical protein n=1 Tax=Halocatena halophila TaxID=2814576 RepID=UPI002ED2D98D
MNYTIYEQWIFLEIVQPLTDPASVNGRSSGTFVDIYGRDEVDGSLRDVRGRNSRHQVSPWFPVPFCIRRQVMLYPVILNVL